MAMTVIATVTTDCICPKAMQSLGTLYGISMGKAMLRTTTIKDCPAHDSCHGYTKAVRAARPEWSDPWCPKHGRKDCPDGKR